MALRMEEFQKYIFFKYCCVRTKKLHKMKVRKPKNCIALLLCNDFGRDYCAYKNTMRMRIYVDFFVLYHFSLKCNDWARIFLRIILALLSKLEKMAIHVSGSQLLFHLTLWEEFCSHRESNSGQKRNGSRILGLICQPNNMSKTLFTFLKMQITAELLKECEQNFASLNILVHFD